MFFFLGLLIVVGTYVAAFKDDFDKESLNAALGVVGFVIGVSALLSIVGSIALG